MTKIDIISGFLGAGKTTFIKKMLKEAFANQSIVLIENEFGEIGVDGGFLEDAGIAIKEMNSGCICCSLVGDFGTSLVEVVEKYSPDRIIIEPSGVGKLSDVVKAVKNVEDKIDLKINSLTTVVDANKCKMYQRNFGEFFDNQVENATIVILSRTDVASEDKIKDSERIIRDLNKNAIIITTPIKALDGLDILEVMENPENREIKMDESAFEHEHHHHDHDCGCGHEHHHDHDCGCGHEHHHHDHDCGCGHEHHHDHDCGCGHEHHHDHDCGCGHEHHHDHDCGCGHEHHHDHDCGCGHEHHHHDHDCGCGHEHHHHDHDCGCGHEHHHHDHDCGCDHEHHHADEVFTSWGKETGNKYSKAELQGILDKLSKDGSLGQVLRAKGMLPTEDGEWMYFDLVPGEDEIRSGKPMFTGRICVIGSKLNEDKLKELFRI